MITDYRKFLTDELPGLIDQVQTASASSELRRQLHTYKGLLAQFSFHYSPHCINEAENRFSVATEWTALKAHEALQPEALRAELERDLGGAANVLGQDFYSSGRRVLVSQRQLQSMEQVARATLAGAEGRSVSPPLRLLLQTLASLSMLDVKAALALHSRSAAPLAARLQKQLAEIQVEGDDVSLPPERYADFFRSLVHVFRNAVDHGLETPEEREMAGKTIEGSIRCSVRKLDNAIEIVIKDDGAGVNREALEDKLVATGESRAAVARLSLADLVFREGLSSRSEATDISGRGIGLAAVKAELDRLGGAALVDSQPGAGTRIQFNLPINQQTSTADAAAEARRIAS
jgi:two-component system chemotaxis sensor kinase CheA